MGGGAAHSWSRCRLPAGSGSPSWRLTASARRSCERASRAIGGELTLTRRRRAALALIAPRELVAFRAAAATRGAYAQQASTGVALVDALELEPGDFEPEVVSEVRATLERLLTNISCRATQRDPNLRPLRVALASLKRRANGLLPARPRTKRPRSTTPPRCALLEAHGPRHLCEHLCYFNFYEPARRRAAAQTPPARPAPAAASRRRARGTTASPTAGPWRPPPAVWAPRGAAGTGRGRSSYRASCSTRRRAGSIRSSAGCCASGPTRRRPPPPTPPPSSGRPPARPPPPAQPHDHRLLEGLSRGQLDTRRRAARSRRGRRGGGGDLLPRRPEHEAVRPRARAVLEVVARARAGGGGARDVARLVWF